MNSRNEVEAPYKERRRDTCDNPPVQLHSTTRLHGERFHVPRILNIHADQRNLPYHGTGEISGLSLVFGEYPAVFPPRDRVRRGCRSRKPVFIESHSSNFRASCSEAAARSICNTGQWRRSGRSQIHIEITGKWHLQSVMLR